MSNNNLILASIDVIPKIPIKIHSTNGRNFRVNLMWSWGNIAAGYIAKKTVLLTKLDSFKNNVDLSKTNSGRIHVAYI